MITMGLLPRGVEEAVHRGSVTADSQSYGLVVLVLLVVLLLEWETLRVVGSKSGRRAGVLAAAVPLAVVFVLTVAARLALLIH